MKTVLHGHYALSVCAAAATLAGCSGSARLPNPTAQTALGNTGATFRVVSPSFATPEPVGPNSSGTEALTGKAKLIKPCHRAKHGWSASFSAHGNATGPYPGTFTASGSWGEYYGRGGSEVWNFSETFTITSGSSTISGTASRPGFGMLSCTVLKNLTVPYTSGSVSGNALINIIQKHDFSETLDGL
jgi:hypothetical protein